LHSAGGFLDMMYKENEGGNIQTYFIKIETIQDEPLEHKELKLIPKKRSEVSKQKLKSKKKSGAKSKTNPTNLGESSNEEEGNK